MPPGGSGEGGTALEPAEPEVRGTEQLVLEVGQMLVQLVASGCSSFNASVRETATKGQSWWGATLPHIKRAHVALGVGLLPALVAPPMAVLSANGPTLQAAACYRLYGCDGGWATEQAKDAAMEKWVEWYMAVHCLCDLAWSLGEEVEAGAAGSALGSSWGADSRSRNFRAVACPDATINAAEAAAKAAGDWPPRDPATLAAATAAAQHLLARWHTIRDALLPPPPADSDASTDDRSLSQLSRIALRLQQRLPHTCSQLVAAAAAALEGSSLAQLQATLMPLLDAASTACKLVLLACSDAAHRSVLGISEAAPANDAPDVCPPCRPYRPIELMLTACQAAAVCVQRLLAQPSPLPLEHQEYARRWEGACAVLILLP